MAGVTENYSKFEVCIVVRFLQAGVSQSVFTITKFSSKRKCLCAATNLKMAKKHWMMVHRNTEPWPHTSAHTVAWLKKWKLESLQHPSHSPDRAPLDFYLFGPFKNFLSGKRFKDQNTLCTLKHFTLATARQLQVLSHSGRIFVSLHESSC